MTKDEERDFQAYLDAQSDPALIRMEMQAEQAWLRRAEFDPESYDEMVRHDMEGRS